MIEKIPILRELYAWKKRDDARFESECAERQKRIDDAKKHNAELEKEIIEIKKNNALSGHHVAEHVPMQFVPEGKSLKIYKQKLVKIK